MWIISEPLISAWVFQMLIVTGTSQGPGARRVCVHFLFSQHVLASLCFLAHAVMAGASLFSSRGSNGWCLLVL